MSYKKILGYMSAVALVASCTSKDKHHPETRKVAAEGGAPSIEELWKNIEVPLSKQLAQSHLAPHSLERIEPNETENILNISKVMFEMQMAQYAADRQADPNVTSRRDAHSKGHVCATAQFQMKGQSDIPKWARLGVFAQPKHSDEAHTYGSIVRFSNGAPRMQPDNVSDGRGIAIKLIDPVLKRNLLGTGQTQDFLMMNSEQFFVKNIKDYLAFNLSLKEHKSPIPFFTMRVIHEALGEDFDDQKTLELVGHIGKLSDPNSSAQAQADIVKITGPEGAQKLFAQLGLFKTGKAPAEAVVIGGIFKRFPKSLLNETYSSVSSYALGKTAVKYHLKPFNCKTKAPTQPEYRSEDELKDPNFDPNQMRTDLINKLSTEDQCFAFYLQKVEAANTELQKDFVEDSRKKLETPLALVATLHIPKQQAQNEASDKYCENLSFNIWQAQAPHRPIGSMNRARRAAITSSSLRRHWLNQVPPREPLSSTELSKLQDKVQ